MLAVGVTGGIGSGKTSVCRVFEQLGVPVYYADERAKSLYVRDAELQKGVKALFGESSYLPTGEFNREWVKAQVFSDQGLRVKLNELVHPRVFKDFELWCGEMMAAGHAYVIKEAAILFESGADATVDLAIGVVADRSVRMRRVMDRDGLSEAEVEARMQSQWPQEQWMDRCAFLIHNNGDRSIIEQVHEIHKLLLLRSA
jgi:dephospho-CoA kinase